MAESSLKKGLTPESNVTVVIRLSRHYQFSLFRLSSFSLISRSLTSKGGAEGRVTHMHSITLLLSSPHVPLPC